MFNYKILVNVFNFWIYHYVFLYIFFFILIFLLKKLKIVNLLC